LKLIPILISWTMITVLSLLPVSLWAGEADVLGVKTQKKTDGSYIFSVTVSHADEGWGHYADRWEVVTLDGKILGTRVLLHPHVGEQPFTRSLAGVEIPEGINKVIIRARDSVHGYGGKEIEVELPEGK
jgi:hypothetical protein